MQRVIEQFIGFSYLDKLPQVHHRNAVTDSPHQSKVVGDEQVGKLAPVAEPGEHLCELGLHGDIEMCQRIVTDDKTWSQGERSRQFNALPLAATEFTRITFHHIRFGPTRTNSSRARSLSSSLLARP